MWLIANSSVINTLLRCGNYINGYFSMLPSLYVFNVFLKKKYYLACDANPLVINTSLSSE